MGRLHQVGIRQMKDLKSVLLRIGQNTAMSVNAWIVLWRSTRRIVRWRMEKLSFYPI